MGIVLNVLLPIFVYIFYIYIYIYWDLVGKGSDRICEERALSTWADCWTASFPSLSLCPIKYSESVCMDIHDQFPPVYAFMPGYLWFYCPSLAQFNLPYKVLSAL